MNTADLTMNQLIEKYSGVVQRKKMRDIYGAAAMPTGRTIESLCRDIDILLAIVDNKDFKAWESAKRKAQIQYTVNQRLGGRLS